MGHGHSSGARRPRRAPRPREGYEVRRAMMMKTGCPPRVRSWMAVRWGVEWYSHNRLNGITRHVMWKEPNIPALFSTRLAAREWINSNLRVEPHGWRVPRAVRVHVAIQVAGVRP